MAAGLVFLLVAEILYLLEKLLQDRGARMALGAPDYTERPEFFTGISKRKILFPKRRKQAP